MSVDFCVCIYQQFQGRARKQYRVNQLAVKKKGILSKFIHIT
jgi:hypothetical protein